MGKVSSHVPSAHKFTKREIRSLPGMDNVSSHCLAFRGETSRNIPGGGCPRGDLLVSGVKGFEFLVLVVRVGFGI